MRHPRVKLKWRGAQVREAALRRAGVELAQLGEAAGRDAGKEIEAETNAEMRRDGSGKKRPDQPRRAAKLSAGEIPRAQRGDARVVADDPVVKLSTEGGKPVARVSIPFRGAGGDRLDRGRSAKETAQRQRNWRAWFKGQKVKAAARRALEKGTGAPESE